MTDSQVASLAALIREYISGHHGEGLAEWLMARGVTVVEPHFEREGNHVYGVGFGEPLSPDFIPSHESKARASRLGEPSPDAIANENLRLVAEVARLRAELEAEQQIREAAIAAQDSAMQLVAGLRGEVARLREALRPFAQIAENHAGDDEEDSRRVSIINAVNRRYPTGELHGDAWYQNGGEFGAHLTRGDLRRARAALQAVEET